MKYTRGPVINYKSVLLFLAIFCAVSTNAQSDSHSFLNINTGNADHESTSSNNSYVETSAPHQCSGGCCKKMYKFFYGEGGTSNLYYKMPGGKRTTHGPTEAIGAQLAYKLKTKEDYRHLLVSAGVELRNLNNVNTISVPKYGLVNDNVHLFYAGIPVMIQYISTKHSPGAKNDINLYAQAGMSFDYKFFMYAHRRDNKKTWEDKKESYNPLLLQPFASVGISYTAKRNIFILGPFLAYNVNDINALSAITGHFTSYGIRLSALMLK